MVLPLNAGYTGRPLTRFMNAPVREFALTLPPESIPVPASGTRGYANGQAIHPLAPAVRLVSGRRVRGQASFQPSLRLAHAGRPVAALNARLRSEFALQTPVMLRRSVLSLSLPHPYPAGARDTAGYGPVANVWHGLCSTSLEHSPGSAIRLAHSSPNWRYVQCRIRPPSPRFFCGGRTCNVGLWLSEEDQEGVPLRVPGADWNSPGNPAFR